MSESTIINANLTPLPDKVGVDGLEDKWRACWDEQGTYRFGGTRERKAVYSIDTPPPTEIRMLLFALSFFVLFVL